MTGEHEQMMETLGTLVGGIFLALGIISAILKARRK